MAHNDSQEVQQAKQRLRGLVDMTAAVYDRVGPPIFSTYGRRLAEIAAIPTGASILDVATGTGAVLFPAAEIAGAGARLVGVDFSEVMIGETQRQIEGLGLGNIEARVMDAEYLDFPDASFDCVLCGFAVFMFPQPGQALTEILRVLKPGGRFALSNWSPPVYQFLGRFLELVKRYWPPEVPVPLVVSVRFADPRGLAAMLAEAGFVAVETSLHDAGFAFAGEDEYWDWLGTIYVTRTILDGLQAVAGPVPFQGLKADFYVTLQEFKHPDGLHAPTGAVFFVARKPTA